MALLLHCCIEVNVPATPTKNLSTDIKQFNDQYIFSIVEVGTIKGCLLLKRGGGGGHLHSHNNKRQHIKPATKTASCKRGNFGIGNDSQTVHVHAGAFTKSS